MNIKKIITVLIVSLSLTTVSVASPAAHHGHTNHELHELHEAHEHHEGHGFGWGGIFGAIVLGGIVAHEVDGYYYDTEDREVRRVVVCNDIPLYTRYGDIYAYQHVCHEEWVSVY